MAKKVAIIPFGQLPCGSKFTSTGGSAFIKLAHDYGYNYENNLAVKVCNGEIIRFGDRTPVFYRY